MHVVRERKMSAHSNHLGAAMDCRSGRGPLRLLAAFPIVSLAGAIIVGMFRGIRSFLYRCLCNVLPRPWQLALAERSIRRHYQRAIEQAKSDADERSINTLEAHEMWEIEEERRQLVSEELVKQATRLRVPIPLYDGLETDGNWERGSNTGRVYLSAKGVTLIQGYIREEEKWKMEKRKVQIA